MPSPVQDSTARCLPVLQGRGIKSYIRIYCVQSSEEIGLMKQLQYQEIFTRSCSVTKSDRSPQFKLE